MAMLRKLDEGGEREDSAHGKKGTKGAGKEGRSVNLRDRQVPGRGRMRERKSVRTHILYRVWWPLVTKVL